MFVRLLQAATVRHSKCVHIPIFAMTTLCVQFRLICDQHVRCLIAKRSCLDVRDLTLFGVQIPNINTSGSLVNTPTIVSALTKLSTQHAVT